MLLSDVITRSFKISLVFHSVNLPKTLSFQLKLCSTRKPENSSSFKKKRFAGDGTFSPPPSRVKSVPKKAFTFYIHRVKFHSEADANGKIPPWAQRECDDSLARQKRLFSSSLVSCLKEREVKAIFRLNNANFCLAQWISSQHQI